MTRKKRAPKRTTKRPYRAPTLTTHGDLRTMTLAKGGSNGDGGGAPKTRVQTGPG
jgi:hypothetical protein